MSAYVCSDRTINALATFAIGPCEVRMTGQEIAHILMCENVRSVNHRYKESEPAHITYKPVNGLAPLAILKICDCYDYQACETDDYDDSVACKLVQRIRSRAIHMLPGYDAAPWGLHD